MTDDAGSAAPPADPDVRRTVLPNGVRLLTEHMPEARSVSIGVWFGVGSRDEPAELAGASHFLEHLLFKGTHERTSRQISLAMDAVGGDLNAYTTREYTVYEARLPARRVDVALDLLAEVVTRPALRAEELDAEREVILDEILLALDTPDDVVHARLYECLFPDHALGRETLGSPETVEEATRRDIADFFDRWYRPANVVVAAAGDVHHEMVAARFADAYGAGEPGSRPGRAAPGAGCVPLVVERRPTEQAYAMVGWRGFDVTDPDRHALWVANHVLGGGPASRLFDEVRERRSLAYAVGSATSSYTDSGTVSVFAGTMPDRVGELLAVTAEVVAGLVADGPTDEEHEAAVGFLEGSLLLGLEDAGSRMARLGAGETLRGEDLVPVDEQIARIRAVTPEAARAALARVTSGRPTVSVVGPFEGDDPTFAPYA